MHRFINHKFIAGFASLLPLQILATVVFALALVSLPIYQDFTKAHSMRVLLTDLEIEIKELAKQSGELPALTTLKTVEKNPELSIKDNNLRIDLQILEPRLAGENLDLQLVKGQFGFRMECRFSEGVFQNDFPKDHGDHCLNAWEKLPQKDWITSTTDFLKDMIWIILAWAGFIALTFLF